MVNKGCVYYTDNEVDEKLGEKCREQLLKSNLPIISVSLKPINFGRNFTLPLKRGYSAYFKQILKGLEESTADIIFLCEHDWFYHPSHFEFTPKEKNVFYYNDNWWRVRADDGFAINYDTHLLPSICAYRETLIEHYEMVVKKVNRAYIYLNMAGREKEFYKYVSLIGFEPGTHNRKERPTEYKADEWKSTYSNLDIRHTTNLTKSKWRQSDFRNPQSCRNWQEKKAWEIDGWDFWSNKMMEKFNITNCQSI